MEDKNVYPIPYYNCQYGWRAKIGVIYPARGYLVEEYSRIAPEGVAFAVTRISLERTTVDVLEKMANDVEACAKLVAEAYPDVITFACTSGSLISGKAGYDEELIRKIEKAAEEVAGYRIPASTTSTAMVAALKKLGIKKLVLTTPYIDSVNQREKAFLEDSGFEVLKIKTMGWEDSYKYAHVHYAYAYRLTKEALLEAPDADGAFISCTGWRSSDVVEMLENEFGKPVTNSNLATLWHAFDILHLKEPIRGYGRLLKEP